MTNGEKASEQELKRLAVRIFKNAIIMIAASKITFIIFFIGIFLAQKDVLQSIAIKDFLKNLLIVYLLIVMPIIAYTYHLYFKLRKIEKLKLPL